MSVERLENDTNVSFKEGFFLILLILMYILLQCHDFSVLRSVCCFVFYRYLACFELSSSLLDLFNIDLDCY